MYVLAIHEDTNSNVALFKDSQLLFAAAEERFTRKKFQQGFPHKGLEYIKENYGVTLANADVFVAGNPHHFLSRLPGILPEGEHDFFGPMHRFYLGLQDRLPTVKPLSMVTSAISEAALRLKAGRKVEFTDHHTAHAYSTYLTSGFEEAVVISADNMGDGFAAKVFDGSGGRCTELYGSSASKSPGQFYGEITQLLGFHCLMAGKVTGLAAYEDWRPAYPLVAQLFSLNDEGTDFIVNPLWGRGRNKGVYKELQRFSPAMVSAATQQRFEDVMVGYARRAVEITGRSKVAMAGGIFGNVKLNQRIMELPEVDEVFIHPAMSDQGIAVGSALAWMANEQPLRPEKLDHVFYGPGFTEEEAGRSLEGARLRYTRPDNMAEALGKLVLDGKVIARCDGRMEYGPRALGHRSILFRPDDPRVNDWLNRKLTRSEFMPFAPVTLAEEAHRCYKNVDKGRYTAEFMTVCFDCTDEMKGNSGGVVHIDGTARPQLIREETDPVYWGTVKYFYEKTGIPSIINTSFNMHGEPIVLDTEDAVRSFLYSRLDYLALGPFLVENLGTDLD